MQADYRQAAKEQMTNVRQTSIYVQVEQTHFGCFCSHCMFLVIKAQTNILFNSSEATNEYGPSNIKWNKIQESIIRKKVNGRWKTGEH